MQTLLTLQDLSNFLFIFVFNFIGSYTHEFWLIYSGKSCKFSSGKVFMSAITMSITIFSASETILEKMSPKMFIGFNFLFGILSYEITMRIQSLNGIIKLVDDFNKFKSGKK